MDHRASGRALPSTDRFHQKRGLGSPRGSDLTERGNSALPSAPLDAGSIRTPAIRVAVGDERRLIAEALAALVGTMPGFAAGGVVTCEPSVSTIAGEPPHLVLVGVEPESRVGFGLVRAFRKQMPDVEIVIVTDVLRPDVVRLVFEERLGGLLLTDMSAADIATCLDEVANGRAILPVGWQRMLADEQDDPLESLSDRQLEVLRLIAEGCSYDEIGRRLFISLNTVKFHVRSIFVRLGVSNRTAAAGVLALHAVPAGPRNHTLI